MADPKPPYPGAIPARFRSTPFKDLPRGLQNRIVRNIADQPANLAPPLRSTVQSEPTPTRRRGRPKGSKNKPKQEMVVEPANLDPEADWAVAKTDDDDDETVVSTSDQNTGTTIGNVNVTIRHTPLD